MANFSSWSEGIILTLAALAVIIIIFGSMDVQYQTSYSTCISGGCSSSGLVDNSNATNLFINNNLNLTNQSRTGEVGFNSLGVSLTTSWTMVLGIMGVVFQFLSGGLLENLINSMGLGAAGTVLAGALRTVWVAGILLFIVYLLFKVKT